MKNYLYKNVGEKHVSQCRKTFIYSKRLLEILISKLPQKSISIFIFRNVTESLLKYSKRVAEVLALCNIPVCKISQIPRVWPIILLLFFTTF